MGVAGYLTLYTADWFSTRNKPLPKIAANLIGTGLLVFAHFKVGLAGSNFGLPSIWRLLGLTMMLVFGALLVYSLYLEIPIRASYLESGNGNLITTGTYSLSRHPGVFWYIFFGLGFILASANTWALVAAPLWIAMNIGLAWFQDRYYFPIMFSGYEEYKTTTPFLIPTTSSFRRFIKQY